MCQGDNGKQTLVLKTRDAPEYKRKAFFGWLFDKICCTGLKNASLAHRHKGLWAIKTTDQKQGKHASRCQVCRANIDIRYREKFDFFLKGESWVILCGGGRHFRQLRNGALCLPWHSPHGFVRQRAWTLVMDRHETITGGLWVFWALSDWHT